MWYCIIFNGRYHGKGQMGSDWLFSLRRGGFISTGRSQRNLIVLRPKMMQCNSSSSQQYCIHFQSRFNFGLVVCSVIRISRNGWHTLLNFLFHTGLTFGVFAGGINQINLPFVCQIVSCCFSTFSA